MNNSKTVTKKIIRIVAVVFMFSFLMYGSYAIFNTSLVVADFNILKAKDLEISYEDDGNGYGDILSIKTNKFMSDEMGKKNKPYRFNVVNRGNKKVNYLIKLVKDEDIIEADGCIAKLLSDEEVKYALNNESVSLLSTVNKNDYIIYNGSLNPNSSDIHEVRIWSNIRDESTIKHFHGKIVVEMIEN